MAKTIMTVDDSTSVRLMIGLTLNEAGFSVVEASDGQEALQKLNNHPVDMLLVDLNMPNMDGIALIKNIRALPRFKFVPIVMLTTESQESKKQEGKAAGATGWIVKPFQPDQLINVIKKVMRS